MARQKASPFEDMIMVVSKLPWWAGITLSLVSYPVLHTMASRPLIVLTGPGQMGAAAARGLFTTLAMFGQYILPLAFGIGACISAFKEFKQKELYEKVAKSSGVAPLNEMTWCDFERLVGEYYRRKGFRVTREGGNGPDGGVDLVLRQKGEIYLVQCKQWKAYKVGVQPVRELYGVMSAQLATGGYFVTSGEFTNEAKNFAKGLNIDLVDGRKLRGMIDIARQPQPARVMEAPRLGPVAVSSTMLPIAPSLPVCPICGAEMKKRVARKGANSGKEFWGCVTYPTCKGTRPLDEAASEQKSAVLTPQPVVVVSVPEQSNCPDCGTEMALRQFQSGPRSGQQFYGCVPCKKGWPIGQLAGSAGGS